MKTKLSLSILMFAAFCSLTFAQVPQGFNYQAIARLTTGDPIINTTLPVRITIQADSLGTSIIWQELHSSVTTNGFGLINLVLGKGARQVVSTVATFSAIDWSVTPKFIKTEINYSGWKTMGVTRLWSVPYAGMAGDLAGSVDKLAVQGKTSGLEEALFEVKNKDGQTVFAVYNEGVRVYVSDGAKALKGGFAVGGFGTDKAESTKYLFVGKDSVRIYLDTNPLTKALKGSFAVGGYDLTKGTGSIQRYLDVGADSVRIYIDSNPATKKLKGGFAVGGYDMTKGTNTNYINVNADTSVIIKPSQNRIYWYPLKNAFLTGRVLIEKPDSVGTNSFASGYESKAKGKYSQALGYKAIARGDYSTAIGKNAVANKINSFALGENAQAKNDESYAFGRGAIAAGFRSFSFGSAGVDSSGQITGVAYAKGDYSFAIGQGSQALGKGAFALGLADTARGNYSVALGYQTRALEWGSTALGNETTASGFYSTAIGNQTTASGWQSTAMGYRTNATHNYSTAMGIGSVAGNTSTAMGGYSNANNYSTAMGWYSTANGGYATAMGGGATASGGASVAMGYESKASGDYSTAMGIWTTASGRASTAMGYYTTASGTGTGSTSIGYYTTASSDGAIAMGTYSTASGPRTTAIGAWATANGSYSTALGYSTTANGYISTVMGYGTYTHSDYETVIGRFNSSYTPASPPGAGWNMDDRLFVVGNGISDVARSNALTVLKNGCVGLQSVTTPTYALQLPNSTNIAVGSGRAYAWTTYSDSRLKENQIPLEYGLKEIMRLFPKQYIHHSSTDQSIWLTENAPKSIGLVAQDVYDVIPEAVNVPENNASELWGLDYDKFIPVLVKAIQEQQTIIESTQEENQQLKSQLQSLQEKVEKIEAMLAKGGGN